MDIRLSIIFIAVSLATLQAKERQHKSVPCVGKHVYNATATAYYPSHHPNEDGFVDMRGKKLRTLQDYIDGRARYVTISIDPSLKIPYGTRVCIPQLNKHYRRQIPFEVRDASDTVWRRRYTRVEICVRSEEDSYDLAVNRNVTLIFA
ncbi:uncharacterized protein LOC124158885 [Ischnura elegans]|uniref:uncharacterized protein LOC124158885 n=1 Tax=Ischnura elegans TaxID=197161 RepID=UPI001ED87F28|nr:uncharacterized protein LOC124158885 [Ischnura elegans]